jgi:hypothetical protein
VKVGPQPTSRMNSPAVRPPTGAKRPTPGPSILWPLAAALLTSLIAVGWLFAFLAPD